MLTDDRGREVFGPHNTFSLENSMFNVIRTKDDADYRGDYVAVEIKHTLGKAALREIIQHAVDLYSKDFVIDAAGIDSADTGSGHRYMVSVDGTSAPSMLHNSLVHAEIEARRLLQGAPTSGKPRTARVLRLEKVLQTKHVTPDIVEIPV